jgi:hypothetical protein
MQIARKETNNDSPMNCPINCLLPAPTTLRTPISLALRKERAVARFMKLMQAMTRMIMPTMENILHILFARHFVFHSPSLNTGKTLHSFEETGLRCFPCSWF